MESIPIVDAHQHFWSFDEERYGWIDQGTMSVLRRNFLPEDLEPIIHHAGVSSTIVVQAE